MFLSSNANSCLLSRLAQHVHEHGRTDKAEKIEHESSELGIGRYRE